MHLLLQPGASLVVAAAAATAAAALDLWLKGRKERKGKPPPAADKGLLVQLGSLDRVCELRLDTRKRVRDGLTPEDIRAALTGFFPHPCTKRYTAIVLLPQAPLLTRLRPSKANAGIWTACSLGLAAVLVGAVAYGRSRR